jgi:hypothetical protein
MSDHRYSWFVVRRLASPLIAILIGPVAILKWPKGSGDGWCIKWNGWRNWKHRTD